MTIKERRVFGGEAVITMMSILILDVIADAAVVERCHAESPVPMLPAEIPTVGEGVMDPFRGGGLDARYELGERQVAWRLQVKMNVVPSPARA